jgi:hypothetical protein
MRARTQNPYAAPASEVKDDAGDRPVLSRAGRALLWLAFSTNLLMAITSISPLFAAAAAEGEFYWQKAVRIALAALSIASLFQRTAAAIFWLSVVLNSLFAALVLFNVAMLMSLRDRMSADAAGHAQAAIVAAIPMGLVCLLTVVVVVLNRGRS